MTTDAQAAILAAALGATSPAMESDQPQPQPVVETLDVKAEEVAKGLKIQKQPRSEVVAQQPNQVEPAPIILPPTREEVDWEAVADQGREALQAALDRAYGQGRFYVNEYGHIAQAGLQAGRSTWQQMVDATREANNPGVARPVGAPIDKTPQGEEHDHER
jgi:hypothetical protein